MEFNPGSCVNLPRILTCRVNILVGFLHTGTVPMDFEFLVAVKDTRKHLGKICLTLSRFFWHISKIIQMICFEKNLNMSRIPTLGNFSQAIGSLFLFDSTQMA